MLLPSAGQQSSAAFLWAATSPQTKQLAAAAGNCSLLQSFSDTFDDNYASIAGGAVYATDMASLHLTCADGQPASAVVPGECPSWTNNTVSNHTEVDSHGTVMLRVRHDLFIIIGSM